MRLEAIKLANQQQLQKDATVVVYCNKNNGNSAPTIAQIRLIEQGFSEVKLERVATTTQVQQQSAAIYAVLLKVKVAIKTFKVYGDT